VIPRPYQFEGADFLAARTRALLADQMRVGKTPQAIMAADKIGAERVLVLCPAIACYQWREQWAEWSKRSPATIIGRDLDISGVGVYIASYNRAVQHLDALRAGPRWDVLIVDEAHFAKNPNAQRTKMVYGKGGIGWNTTCLWSLTGTPSPNHAGETWPMLRAFGATRLSYLEFVRHFCYYNEREERVYGNKPQHLAELRKLLAPFTLRRTLAEVAPELPPVSYNMLAIERVAGVDLRSEDISDIDPEDRIEVALAKTGPLAKEIVGCLDGQDYNQTVVFGYHVEPLRRLTKLLQASGVNAELITGATSLHIRERIRTVFTMGLTNVLVGQIMAAGTGIDLSAAQHGYFLELDYVPGNNSQAAHRLVNMQTNAPVTFDVLTMPGTKDDRVQRTLLRKVRSAVFKS
jgi:SNF2 family DNA or RNA helicase